MTPDPAPAPVAKLRLGGMALRNGLLVHGPTHWAAAVRNPAGGIEVASGKKPRFPETSVPGARGVIKLGEAMLVIPLVKKRLPAAQLPFQNAQVLGTMAGAAAVGSLLRRRVSGLRGEALLAAVSITPSLLALRSGDLAAYHGVEHKAIAAYEQGDEDAREAKKEHDRCGSHLMAPMLTANVAGTALLKKLVDKPTNAQAAALQLASVGLAVEVFAWSEKHADSAAARALRVPGYELQRLLGTREPSEEQLQVGRAALEEILRVEGDI